MIPENIHSLPLAAFRDSEHKRGFGSEYPEGLDGKVFVNQEQADCGSRIKFDQAGVSVHVDMSEQMAWVVQQTPHRRGLKVDELVDRLITIKQICVSF